MNNIKEGTEVYCWDNGRDSDWMAMCYYFCFNEKTNRYIVYKYKSNKTGKLLISDEYDNIETID